VANPFPKSQQLARGERRYKRKVASPKQWQAIIAAKKGPCRICSARNPLELLPGQGTIQLHHLVTREDHGDDVPDNIVPVCEECHDALHRRAPAIGRLLLSRLSDAEYAYMIGKGGEDYAERAYGVSYGR
jgi:predicted HNH restriction endonuclease